MSTPFPSFMYFSGKQVYDMVFSDNDNKSTKKPFTMPKEASSADPLHWASEMKRFNDDIEGKNVIMLKCDKVDPSSDDIADMFKEMEDALASPPPFSEGRDI